MSGIRTCFRRTAAIACIGALLAGCRGLRKIQSQYRQTADSLSLRSRLAEATDETGGEKELDWEVVRISFFPPDSSTDRTQPPAPREATVARSSRRSSARQVQTAVVRDEVRTQVQTERQEEIRTEPARDPRRWRYIFYTAVVIGLGLVALRFRKRI